MDTSPNIVDYIFVNIANEVMLFFRVELIL